MFEGIGNNSQLQEIFLSLNLFIEVAILLTKRPWKLEKVQENDTVIIKCVIYIILMHNFDYFVSKLEER